MYDNYSLGMGGRSMALTYSKLGFVFGRVGSLATDTCIKKS